MLSSGLSFCITCIWRYEWWRKITWYRFWFRRVWRGNHERKVVKALTAHFSLTKGHFDKFISLFFKLKSIGQCPACMHTLHSREGHCCGTVFSWCCIRGNVIWELIGFYANGIPVCMCACIASIGTREDVFHDGNANEEKGGPGSGLERKGRKGPKEHWVRTDAELTRSDHFV